VQGDAMNFLECTNRVVKYRWCRLYPKKYCQRLDYSFVGNRNKI